MIEQMERLCSLLKNCTEQGRAYTVLSFMAAANVERDCREVLKFEAAAILAACGTAKDQQKEARLWMPKELPLQNALRVIQQELPRPHIRLGYSKGGGRGIPSLYWLELEPDISEERTASPEAVPLVAHSNLDSHDEKSEEGSKDRISYRRTESSEIKPSLLGRVVLRDGKFWNRSKRGLLTLIGLYAASLVWLGLYALVLNSLVGELSNITIAKLAIVAAFSYGIWLVWRDLFRPWYLLVNDCVVMAPQWFVNSFEDDCQLEMYRTSNKERWTRLVRFNADCPSCGSTVEIRPGKPDHKLPLVGRCKESPYAHVYSFDRMTLEGVFIGPK